MDQNNNYEKFVEKSNQSWIKHFEGQDNQFVRVGVENKALKDEIKSKDAIIRRQDKEIAALKQEIEDRSIAADDDDENQCIITFNIDGKTYIETVEFDDDDERFLDRDDEFIDWIERFLPDGVDKGECMDIDYEIKLRVGFEAD